MTTIERLLDPADLINFDSLLSSEELALRDTVRGFVKENIKPNIAQWYNDAVFPLEIVPEMAKLGLLGMHLQGYGCAGRSAVEYGIAGAELEAGDSGLRTFVSVQGSLAMSAIYKHGSEEQKQEWLPKMAAGEAIGCFGAELEVVPDRVAELITRTTPLRRMMRQFSQMRRTELRTFIVVVYSLEWSNECILYHIWPLPRKGVN